MHTSHPDIQMPRPGRRRGRYSDEFKRQVIAACLEPGVSKAAIALANGLNANLLRRWLADSAQRSDTGRSKPAATLTPTHISPACIPEFIPVQFESPSESPFPSPASAVLQTNIRIELQHATQVRHFLHASD
jgi:hypothetical protein